MTSVTQPVGPTPVYESVIQASKVAGERIITILQAGKAYGSQALVTVKDTALTTAKLAWATLQQFAQMIVKYASFAASKGWTAIEPGVTYAAQVLTAYQLPISISFISMAIGASIMYSLQSRNV